MRLTEITPAVVKRYIAENVMDEMGHTKASLALEVYHQARRRAEGETVALRAIVEGGEFRPTMGQREEFPEQQPPKLAL